MKLMNRRAFVGMGAMSAAAALAGCAATPQAAEEEVTEQPAAEAVEEVVEEAAKNWQPTATNPDVQPMFPDAAPAVLSDEEVETILNNPAVVTTDWVNSDGTTISPAMQMVRNTINRNGIGMGSVIAMDHQLDLWPTLFTEDEAAFYVKLPAYKKFTAAEAAEAAATDEAAALALCNQIADKGLMNRSYDASGAPLFHTVGSEYGYYEAYVQHFTKDYLDLKDLNQGVDIALDFLDSETSMYRTLPVSLDVIIDGQYGEYDDWRAIFERNDTFAVSPCMCRSKQLMQSGAAESTQQIIAEDIRMDNNHPCRTCLTTGDQAKYFIETGAGEQITKDEAIAIIEDGIENYGMIVETVYTKAAESVCLCHAGSCLNVGAVRTLNGGPAMENYSSFKLMHIKEDCIKCGACVERCPMFAIAQDEEGYPIVDNACVRCGQCATVCPQGVRGLLLQDNPHEIPDTMLDDYIAKARVRIAKGHLFDITSQEEMTAIATAAMEAMGNIPTE